MNLEYFEKLKAFQEESAPPDFDLEHITRITSVDSNGVEEDIHRTSISERVDNQQRKVIREEKIQFQESDMGFLIRSKEDAYRIARACCCPEKKVLLSINSIFCYSCRGVLCGVHSRKYGFNSRPYCKGCYKTLRLGLKKWVQVFSLFIFKFEDAFAQYNDYNRRYKQFLESKNQNAGLIRGRQPNKSVAQ